MHGWFPIAWTHEIEHFPVARSLLGKPVVLYRSQAGQVHVFDDRCPHRHAPLSEGTLVEGHLQCPYHGWSFNEAG